MRGKFRTKEGFKVEVMNQEEVMITPGDQDVLDLVIEGVRLLREAKGSKWRRWG